MCGSRDGSQWAVNYSTAGSIVSHKQTTSSRVLAMNGVWNPATGWIIVLISVWLIVGCLGKGNIGEYVVLINLLPCTVLVVCLIGRIFGLYASLLSALSNGQCCLLLCRTAVRETWIRLENVNLTDTLFCDKCVFCVNVFQVRKHFIWWLVCQPLLRIPAYRTFVLKNCFKKNTVLLIELCLCSAFSGILVSIQQA